MEEKFSLPPRAASKEMDHTRAEFMHSAAFFFKIYLLILATLGLHCFAQALRLLLVAA